MASSSSNQYMQAKFPWEYPREHMQDEGFKLILTGKETLISRIKMRLAQYDGIDPSTALKKTIFVDYMRLPNFVVKSNRCIHYICEKGSRIEARPDPMTIYYKVNGQMVRFGRLEFALVSGLRFGASKIDPYSQNVIAADSVYTRLFGNKPISPLALWNWFKDDKNFRDLIYDDCFKISQILIAVHIFLGFDSVSSKIPGFVWVLIGTQKDWDKFPWGSLSYQILVKLLKLKVCLHPKAKRKGGKEERE